ncbi:hypothetical protein WR25_12626 isoform C [Diploscapter pachys]|uniref:Histone acetyltransferase n=1 Tax=Diploscapter pachys TaxID=2018661 RepID=A0A2A2LYP6_9BILA|nr:hypothetical protein WR25_12626 isoform C [Diploscapter pachys]
MVASRRSAGSLAAVGRRSLLSAPSARSAQPTQTQAQAARRVKSPGTSSPASRTRHSLAEQGHKSLRTPREQQQQRASRVSGAARSTSADASSKPKSVQRKESIQKKKEPVRVKQEEPQPAQASNDDDKIKTRRLHKTVVEKMPRCTICKQPKPELYACSGCGLYYHLRKCYRLPERQVANVFASKHWFCAKCVRCQACNEMIDDPSNVECVQCGLVWHGRCRPQKGSSIDGQWACAKCTRKEKTDKPGAGNSNKKKDARLEAKKDVYDFDGDDTAMFAPDFTLRKMDQSSPGSLLGSVKQEELGSSSDNSKKKGKPSKSDSRKRKMVDKQQQDVLNDEKRLILDARSEIYDELLDAHNRRVQTEGSGARKSASRSPTKSPEKKSRRLVLQEDKDLFMSTLKEYQSIKREAVPAATSSTIDKWVYLGGTQKMKAIYESPYPEEIRRAPAIYVCAFCLTAQEDKERYRIHQSNCEFRHPPGNEIYRDSEISFFEIDGSKQQWYCRNLCLLAKLFISSKTLHHEVDTFFFYVLTEHTEEGCQLVGYFSKEKNPSKNNNLSCLLTLPTSQRSGYGRLLIDMSYELSRVERKVGSPEHPLSDLGLLTYRGYWRSSILCYLRAIRQNPHTSIKDMSLQTRIHPTDIINQLMHDRLLVYKHGVYYIKAAKRAYKWPLSTCRRRTVDSSKLQWKPSFDETQLDPSRLNYYNVKLVCKKFNNIVSNEQWWRVQINRKKYYLTHTEANDPKFLAVRTFENIRKEERRWLHDNENVVQQFTEPCASTIDGVRLFRTKDPDLRRFCLAGCRDRSLTLWHLQDIENPNDTLPVCLQKIDGAHDGWIWRIDKVTEEGKFMTCGWDQICKEWQIGENGMITVVLRFAILTIKLKKTIQELSKYELPSAATCSARITPHQFIVGTFNHTIHLFDTREPPKKYGNQFDLHKRAIIGLENKDHYIYTTSEDRHIFMSDIRMTSPKAINDKILRVYAPSLSLNANQLICGYGNRIRIMDPLTLDTVHEFVVTFISIFQRRLYFQGT